MNVSAYIHSRLSVLKGWSTCSGKVVHAQDDGIYGVGRFVDGQGVQGSIL